MDLSTKDPEWSYILLIIIEIIAPRVINGLALRCGMTEIAFNRGRSNMINLCTDQHVLSFRRNVLLEALPAFTSE